MWTGSVHLRSITPATSFATSLIVEKMDYPDWCRCAGRFAGNHLIEMHIQEFPNFISPTA
jgi:hypothetical protein